LTVSVLVVAIVSAVATQAAEPMNLSHGPDRRSDRVTSIVFSPDGKWVAGHYRRHATDRAGDDRRAFVAKWEIAGKARTIVPASAKTPRNVRSHTPTARGAEPVAVKNLRLTRLIAPRDRVRVSRDGKLIAIGGRGKTVLRTSDGKPVKTFLAGGGAVAFSADSKRLAAADNRGIIRVWDIATAKLVRTLRLDDHKENTVLAAAVQCASKFGDPAGNRKRIASFVTRAARKGAKIVVLPETAITGYMTSDTRTAWQVPGRELGEGLKGVDPKDAAETVPGPSTKLFAPLAEQYGIYLTVPLLEVDRKTGKYYNTSVLLGPDGRILIHYRKRNPWIWAEKGWAENGNLGNPVADTPFGRLGLLICFDVHKQFEVMSKRKIDTLLYSIAWVDAAGSDWFSKLLPARTKDCNFNVIGANWTVPKNPKPDWHGYGQSLIISPKGKVLAKAKNDLAEETVFAEIPIPAK
jgi:predicted amidohydrolase